VHSEPVLFDCQPPGCLLLNHSGTLASGGCNQLCSVAMEHLLVVVAIDFAHLIWHFCQLLLLLILLNHSGIFASGSCKSTFSIAMAHFPVVVASKFAHLILHICQ